jgi:pimeloyl-ACP methyl ester carboxylesterase
MRAIVSLGRDKMNNTLNINGHRLAYSASGSPSNPPIIFVHGLTSHRGVWTRTIESLQDRFHCIALDLLGFGDSDKPKDGDYTIAKQAERVLKAVDQFGFDKFTAIGHSMGGQIVTYLTATLAPQRVSKLISVDGVVTGELSGNVQNFKRLLIVVGQRIPSVYHLMRSLCKWKPAACWAFDHWFYKPAIMPFDSWEADRYYALDSDNAQSTPKAWKSLNATDLTSILKNITVPTLVIFGKQDGTVPVSQAQVFKEKLPAARLALIDQCGHFPMVEKFDECIQLLNEFL